METTVSNLSSQDLDRLPRGQTSLGKHTISYNGKPIISVLATGPVATTNEWFEFQTYRKGRRVHISIFDKGGKPPDTYMDVPNFDEVAELVLKKLQSQRIIVN